MSKLVIDFEELEQGFFKYPDNGNSNIFFGYQWGGFTVVCPVVDNEIQNISTTFIPPWDKIEIISEEEFQNFNLDLSMIEKFHNSKRS